LLRWANFIYVSLAWHSQLPQWVRVCLQLKAFADVALKVKNINNAATLTSVLQNHITTVMTRYKGQILHWDVANEVIDDNSGGLRSSVFSNVRLICFVLSSSNLSTGVGRERA